MIRRVLAVMDGSEFEADDFPGIEDAQAAGRELDALLAELEQAERSRDDCKTAYNILKAAYAVLERRMIHE